MSRIPIGIDIIEIYRIEQAMLSWQNSFLRRIYTGSELETCRNVASRLATRFAAKEAVMKALSTGTIGLNWRDIEVLSGNDGVPSIRLHGRACEKAREMGVKEFSVTMSHSRQYATAFVIGYAE